MNCNSGSSASQAGPSDDFPNSVPWRFSRTTLQVPQIILLAMNPFCCVSSNPFCCVSSNHPSFRFETFPVFPSLNETILRVSSGLKRTVFSSVASLTSVQLEGNPLHCDCRLEWLAVWLSSKVCLSCTSSIQLRMRGCCKKILASFEMEGYLKKYPSSVSLISY